MIARNKPSRLDALKAELAAIDNLLDVAHDRRRVVVRTICKITRQPVNHQDGGTAKPAEVLDALRDAQAATNATLDGDIELRESEL